MPDTSALFPQPPQQNQQSNSLLSNPGQAIGLMQGLQNLQIQRQQMPALVQQPAAQLRQTNVGTEGALQDQQKDFADNATRSIAGYLASVRPGTPISDEMLREAAAVTANKYGRQSKLFPDVIPGLRQVLMESKDRAGTIARLQSSILPVGTATESSPIGVDPNTGQPVYGTRSQQLNRASGGGYPQAAPVGTEANTGAMLADQQRTSGYAQEISRNEKALDLIKKLGIGATGPGSDKAQQFESAIVRLFPNIASEALKNKVSQWDQLHKYLVNGAQEAAQQQGPHTNAGLATSITGRPNADISSMANEELLHMNNAYRRLEQTQVDQAAKYGGRTNYLGEKNRLSTELDPDAFRIMAMTPDERKAKAKKMSPAEKERFNRSVQMGIESGVIFPPGR